MPSPRAERERATEEASEYRTRPTSDKTQDALRGPGATPGIRLSVGDVPPPVYCGTTRPEGFSVKLWDLLIKPPHLDHLFLSAVVTTHCNVRGLQQGNVPKQPLTQRSDTSTRPTTMPSQESSPVSTPRTPASTPRADRSPPLPLRQPRARPGTLESEEIYNPDMMRLLLSEDCLESDGKENTPPFILRAARRHERLTPRRLSDALQDSNPSTRQMLTL